VYDANRNPITPPNITVLQNSNGTEIVQIGSALSNATYFVSVANASGTTGRYSLGIDFSTRVPEADTTFASGSVSTTNGAAGQQAFGWVSIAKSTVFHLDISAIGAAGTAIEVTLLDRAGHVVFDSNTALQGHPLAGGSTLSVNVFLAVGDYELRVVGGASSGSQPPTISYNVMGRGLTDAIDPQLISPFDPMHPPRPVDPFGWTTSQLFQDFLALVNPYGDPIMSSIRPPS
jgi:hypothetical protein